MRLSLQDKFGTMIPDKFLYSWNNILEKYQHMYSMYSRINGPLYQMIKVYILQEGGAARSLPDPNLSREKEGHRLYL
jgi:hypothetical protein